MKNRIICICGLFLFLLVSCTEIPVVIPMVQVPDGDRKVLIEEFTGVNCNNCPNGSKIIEEMIAEIGEKVVAISIHHGPFAVAIEGTQNDLKSTSEYGKSIIELMGKGPLGYPAAVVNRAVVGSKLFPKKDEWKSLVIDELKKPAQVSIFINHSFDEASRNIDVALNVLPLEEGLEDLNVTLVITESGVIDAQRLPDYSIQKDYVHNHVLRDVLGNPKGQLVDRPYNSGVPIEIKMATYHVNPEWKVENCKLIAIVHHKDNSNEVIQVEEVHL